MTPNDGSPENFIRSGNIIFGIDVTNIDVSYNTVGDRSINGHNNDFKAWMR